MNMQLITVARHRIYYNTDPCLSRAAWTTAAVCSSGHRVQSQTSFSASSVQLPLL